MTGDVLPQEGQESQWTVPLSQYWSQLQSALLCMLPRTVPDTMAIPNQAIPQTRHFQFFPLTALFPRGRYCSLVVCRNTSVRQLKLSITVVFNLGLAYPQGYEKTSYGVCKIEKEFNTLFWM
jgi:hypothetical protein